MSLPSRTIAPSLFTASVARSGPTVHVIQVVGLSV
jgi:hypothetical protein